MTTSPRSLKGKKGTTIAIIINRSPSPQKPSSSPPHAFYKLRIIETLFVSSMELLYSAFNHAVSARFPGVAFHAFGGPSPLFQRDSGPLCPSL